MISLAGGLPDASMFPVDALATIAGEVIARDGARVLQYGVTRGEESARAALATLYGDPLFDGADPDHPDTGHPDPDDLVVTTGSQQGLDLVARVLLDPGDVVVTGDPEYLGVLQILRSVNAAVHPIPIDGDGLDTAVLADRLEGGLRPKACYIVPHFHNPTGATMSTERRAHLHELSSKYGFVVIEDDPYRELYYDGERPEERVGDPDLTVRFRSTSKVLAPGLRIGSLTGPAWLREAVVTAKQSADLHTSTVTQAIVAEALRSPWLAEHLDALRRTYGHKRDVLVAALHDAFGDGVRFETPAGGMFVWAEFGGDVDTATWLNAALEHLVCFVPGAAFAVERELASSSRLSFVTPPPDDLREGVLRLVRSRPASKY